MIFYTADLHLGHENIIALSKRPYKDSVQMLKVIMKNWNSAVTDNDEVYIIGDLFFKINSTEQLEILRSLNGKKHLILGNHDKGFNSNVKNEFVTISDYKKIDDNGRRIILSHYPILEWEGYFRGAYHIYGHIHNNFDTPAYRIIKNNPEHFKNAFNAGIDVTGYTPRTLDELILMNASEKISE